MRVSVCLCVCVCLSVGGLVSAGNHACSLVKSAALTYVRARRLSFARIIASPRISNALRKDGIAYFPCALMSQRCQPPFGYIHLSFYYSIVSSLPLPLDYLPNLPMPDA